MPKNNLEVEFTARLVKVTCALNEAGSGVYRRPCERSSVLQGVEFIARPEVEFTVRLVKVICAHT